jgi:adenylate kinase
VLNEAPFVADTVMARLKKLQEEGQGILLDGFPRAVEQMEYIMPFALKTFGKENIIVLYLDIEEKDTVFRNTHRRICELLRHPMLYVQETKNLTCCPLDGSKLITRSLDSPEIIKTRIVTFKEETLPLLEYFKKRGILVHTVSGEGSVSAVFERISTIIEKI